MKTINLTFLLLFLIIGDIFSGESNAFTDKRNDNSKTGLNLAIKFSEFYNQILSDQSAIKKINLLRPKIYIYTDFGGGKNKSKPLIDLQTSGEISSAAWKETLQQELYINDSAEPLSPIQAGYYLAKTFPYEEKYVADYNIEKISIHTIVVHVVDPGVGNDLDEINPQPRSLILRKDGVLFIGPDNGTLSFTCPTGSIAASWEINADALTLLSGIDTKVGGTFHGRDLFSEAAFRIAAGIVSPDEIGIPYEIIDLKNRVVQTKEHQKDLKNIPALEFEKISTERLSYDSIFSDESDLFEKAFLLGIVQSSLYQDNQAVALTSSKKLFFPKENDVDLSDLIAIVNYKNGNIFIGPNNGLGSSFIKNFSSEDIEVFSLSKEVYLFIKNENNNEIVTKIIEHQPKFLGFLKEIDFFGGEKDLIVDQFGHPKILKAKIWIDLYGNIKTTALSDVLNEIKQLRASVNVTINGVKQSVSFADTFSQVPKEQLFIYNGSTGAVGLNPHRSKRYVELTSNGIYGKFGVDFFDKAGIKPKSGDIIWLYFDYPEIKK